MADSSWDNGGHGVPLKTGLPLWGKIALGCGIAFLVALVTCVGGVAFIANKVKKDPEGFKQKAMNLVADKVRPDWEDFRAVVEQLRTPEGCRALYAANPGLAKTWATESDFLQASSKWQKDLAPVPDLTPELMDHQGLRINHDFGGKVEVGWSPKSGPAVYVTFEGARKAGDTGPRRVTGLDVR
ncbi:hypothetical protein [Geothrix sp.]|jgi:hypothetical protein|uniref:hypothetical protein n=1 Tax=Geothrix sp. TaxID=1962974 RepID=UPI0025C5F06E|nr:hypothetical protein [Geothrix sp.]